MSQLSLANVPKKAVPPDGASDHWFTPTRYFAPWHREFRFTLDVAATAESTKASHFFDIGMNGLEQNWAGHRCWMNPPYSDIAPWAEKALLESQTNGALVVGLLPAWTDRAWWADFVEPFREGRRADSPGPVPGEASSGLREYLKAASVKNPVTGCRTWNRPLDRSGYGGFRWKGRMVLAHRLSYEAHIGPIPPGFFVCHRCDRRSCINPCHLFLGSAEDNAKDRDTKGRQARGEKCRRGHLTAVDVSNIKRRSAAGESRADLGREFMVNPSTVSRIALGQRWAAPPEPKTSPIVEVRFIRGRIRFGFPGNPEGLGHHGGGTFPNCLVIWRPAQ